MAALGRQDRSGRLTESRGGAWASSSQDYVRLAHLLFEQSSSCARALDGNCSIYPLAGIPVLCSALRALLIEANSGMYGAGESRDLMKKLASAANELSIFSEKYAVPQLLREKLALLYEVRNEIVHPAHMPAGTTHGTPAYLLPLRDAGLLQSTKRDNSDYTWMAQLQSHRLFAHAFETIESSASIILERHHVSAESRSLHLESYARYKAVDL
ncbi:hypothetical protein [Peristeroidobacter soli]|jgi:hypothetical protein|uniref:hypothetical protein n=1 Tax=Peristeroidobacter soli TaxID=2497877 RepID=UPI00101D7A49|nr:hypothetical protein [Peristeroidobacter soli]